MDPSTQQQSNSLDAGYQNNDKKCMKNDCLPTRPGMAIVLTNPVCPEFG